jgi:hypothetical protein
LKDIVSGWGLLGRGFKRFEESLGIMSFGLGLEFLVQRLENYHETL